MRAHNAIATARRTVRLAIVMCAVAAAFVTTAVAAADGDPAPGMRVYRDPVTGAFTSPPASASEAPATPSGARAAAPILVETPGTSAAGGVMIDLGGAFQSSITATVDGGGVRTDCRSDGDGATRK